MVTPALESGEGLLTAGILSIVRNMYACGNDCDRASYLVKGGALDAVVRAAKVDATGDAWSVLALMADHAITRKRAHNELQIPELFAGAFARGGRVAVYAMKAMDSLTGDEDRCASAIAQAAGVIEGLGGLLVATTDAASRYLALQAAYQLNNLLSRQPSGINATPLEFRSTAASASHILERAANVAFESTLRLANLPPSADFERHHKKVLGLLKTLAQSERGGRMAREAFDAVIDANDGHDSDRRLELSLLLVRHLMTPCFDLAIRDPARELGSEFVASLRRDGIVAQDCAATLLLLQCLPNVKDILHGLLADGSLMPMLLELLDGDDPDVSRVVIELLQTVVAQPIGHAVIMQTDALAKVIAMWNTFLVDGRGLLPAWLKAFIERVGQAGGDAFLQVAEALTKTHNVVALLLTQIQADPMLERAATSSCCGVLAHLARIDAGASALRQLISSRSVVALRKVLSTTHHVRAAALKSCGLLTALSGWLADVGDRPLTERVATLGLVRDLASAPDVPTEQYLLPLLRLIVPLLEAVATADGDGATELDALEVMHLTSALSSAKEGMRELHKAKVLPMLVRLMRAGDLAGDGTYIKECVALLHNALADTSSAADAALVVTEVVELLPADSTFDPFDVADARFAMRVLTELLIPRLNSSNDNNDNDGDDGEGHKSSSAHD